MLIEPTKILLMITYTQSFISHPSLMSISTPPPSESITLPANDVHRTSLLFDPAERLLRLPRLPQLLRFLPPPLRFVESFTNRGQDRKKIFCLFPWGLFWDFGGNWTGIVVKWDMLGPYTGCVPPEQLECGAGEGATCNVSLRLLLIPRHQEHGLVYRAVKRVSLRPH